MWEVELIVDEPDIAELKAHAVHWGCVIVSEGNGRTWMSGDPFDALTDAEEVRAEAERIMKLLNGYSRTRWRQFRPVQLGARVARTCPDGRRHVVGLAAGKSSGRARAAAVSTDAVQTDGQTEPTEGETHRVERIKSNQNLQRVLEVFAGDTTWQRLRAGAENLGAAISGRLSDKNAWVWAFVQICYVRRGNEV
jgi:hypothetical protein